MGNFFRICKWIERDSKGKRKSSNKGHCKRKAAGIHRELMMRINRQTNSLEPENTGGREGAREGVHSTQPDKVRSLVDDNEKNPLEPLRITMEVG